MISPGKLGIQGRLIDQGGKGSKIRWKVDGVARTFMATVERVKL